jgi:hypothetical protein
MSLFQMSQQFSQFLTYFQSIFTIVIDISPSILVGSNGCCCCVHDHILFIVLFTVSFHVGNTAASTVVITWDDLYHLCIPFIILRKLFIVDERDAMLAAWWQCIFWTYYSKRAGLWDL